MEKFFEHQIGFNEFITGNRFIDICTETGATFCKTDFIPQHKDSQYKVFVTHNSDYHIEKVRYSMGPNCGSWFAQNKDLNKDKIISIPIGIENMTLRDQNKKYASHSSEVRGAFQKANLIDKIKNYNLKKTGFAYMNFNISTHPVERQYVWNRFFAESWTTTTSNLSMEKFYFDIASHKFVFSPRGNGVDCHRTWEALYLGTIPIVRNSIHMKNFKDLPIFFLDSWEEVCYNKLNDFYHHVKNELYNLDKMKISYWKSKINEKLHF